MPTGMALSYAGHIKWYCQLVSQISGRPPQPTLYVSAEQVPGQAPTAKQVSGQAPTAEQVSGQAPTAEQVSGQAPTAKEMSPCSTCAVTH
jgi:hypothetical protein